MASHHPLRHWLLLLALTICVGSTFILTKIALRTLSPMSIVFGRLVLASLLFLPLAWLERRAFRELRGHWGQIALLAFTWMAFPFSVSTWGQQALPSATSGVLMAVMPLGVIVLAHFFLPGERLTAQKAFGFAVGFAGICVLMGAAAKEAFSGDIALFAHKLALLASALSYAVCIILARKMPVLPRIPMCFATLAVSALMVAPLSVPGAFADFAQAAPASLFALLGVAVLPTALGFVLNMRLVAEAGASFSSYLNYLVPLWATFLGAGLAHEHLGLNTYLALPIILAGIAISQFRRGAARA